MTSFFNTIYYYNKKASLSETPFLLSQAQPDTVTTEY